MSALQAVRVVNRRNFFALLGAPLALAFVPAALLARKENRATFTISDSMPVGSVVTFIKIRDMSRHNWMTFPPGPYKVDVNVPAQYRGRHYHDDPRSV